jgi:RNA polymerase sigma-70 factor (ECF subfamily)
MEELKVLVYQCKIPSMCRCPSVNSHLKNERSQELIARCNRGETEAWEELYARYYGKILCVVRRFARDGSDEAQDLVQEVFINLMKALKTFDDTRSPEAYILEIARRVGIGRFRKETAAKRGGDNPGHLLLDAHDGGQEEGRITIPSGAHDQETALRNAQERSLLRGALKRLSETCRELLELRYEKGLSYKEIAAQTNAKEGTLRVRVQRCLNALSTAYSESPQQEAVST